MTDENGGDVPGFSYMKPEDEAAFVRLMLGFIEQHKLRTPDFIKAHIRAFDSYGATEMADFWRDALAVYEQALALGEASYAAISISKLCGNRLGKGISV